MIIVPDESMIEVGTVYYEDYAGTEWSEQKTPIYECACVFYYGNEGMGIENRSTHKYFYEAVQSAGSDLQNFIGTFGENEGMIIFQVIPEQGRKEIICSMLNPFENEE